MNFPSGRNIENQLSNQFKSPNWKLNSTINQMMKKWTLRKEENDSSMHTLNINLNFVVQNKTPLMDP